MNQKLSKEEVEIALNQLHPDKDLGPDGFPACFYKKC